jgi:hypothetical protein
MLLGFICLDASSWDYHSALERFFSGYCIQSVFECRSSPQEFTALLGHVIVYCALNSAFRFTQGGG